MKEKMLYNVSTTEFERMMHILMLLHILPEREQEKVEALIVGYAAAEAKNKTIIEGGK